METDIGEVSLQDSDRAGVVFAQQSGFVPGALEP
jgi:hypothetical protein